MGVCDNTTSRHYSALSHPRYLPVNQPHVNANRHKIDHAIMVAARGGTLSLGVHRDYSGRFVQHSAVALGTRMAAVSSGSPQTKPRRHRSLSATPRRTAPSTITSTNSGVSGSRSKARTPSVRGSLSRTLPAGESPRQQQWEEESVEVFASPLSNRKGSARRRLTQPQSPPPAQQEQQLDTVVE